MACYGITDSAALPDGRDVSGLKGSQEPKIEPTGSSTENVFGQSAVSSSLLKKGFDLDLALADNGSILRKDRTVFTSSGVKFVSFQFLRYDTVLGSNKPGDFGQECFFELVALLGDKYRLLRDFAKDRSLNEKFFYTLRRTKIGKYFHHILIIKGRSDNQMIQAGKKYNLPRGFKILFTSTRDIQLLGEGETLDYSNITVSAFYPKFANDPRTAEEVTLVPSNVKNAEIKELIGFKKFSGSLGTVAAYEIDGTIFVSVTSKNDCVLVGDHDVYDRKTKKTTKKTLDVDSKRNFIVREMENLFLARYFSPELLIELAKSGKSLSFECMLESDQTHGNLIYQSAMVLTCVFEDYGYWTLDRVREFGIHHNLGVATLFQLRGEAKIKAFLDAFLAERNSMTDSCFDELAAEHDVTCLPGTKEHAHKFISGDTLEGVVWHVSYDHYDSKRKEVVPAKHTVKVKHPDYVGVTMIVRECCDDKHINLVGEDLRKSIRKRVMAWFVNLSHEAVERIVDFYEAAVLRCRQQMASTDPDHPPFVAHHLTATHAIYREYAVENGLPDDDHASVLKHLCR
jgi:hypothetical protein